MIHWADPYSTPTGIVVSKAGHDVTHDATYRINRPSGFGNDFVFAAFTTRVEAGDAAGRRVERHGACIMYTPGHAQWLRAVGGRLTHHWFHVSGKRARRLIEESGVPLNAVFYPLQSDFIAPMIAALCRELSMQHRFWDQVVALQIEQFMLLLGRSCTEKPSFRGVSREHRERLTDLRSRVYAAPQQDWNLQTLAREAYLSVSRFSCLYQTMFSVSPVDDVITARMQKARWLLANTTSSVSGVAERTGFADAAFFSRQFSRRMGVAPKKWQMEQG